MLQKLFHPDYGALLEYQVILTSFTECYKLSGDDKDDSAVLCPLAHQPISRLKC